MPTVFVSYRRGDSEGQARSLNFELVRLIGKDSVFMDVDSIALGRDFRHVLHERLESCDLMLVLIGPGWLEAKDAAGNRRLDSATDYVRQEISAALKRNIRVTPVLVQGAQMPAPERLPEDIKELVYRNGFELGHSTWESDVSELARRLGLDRESAAPGPAPVASNAAANAAISTASGTFKTYWVVATIVGIAIIAAVLFLRAPRDGDPGSGIAASPQQPAGSPPQQPAGSPPPQGVGLGAIAIPNLKTGTVEVYGQSSSAAGTYSQGYAGTLSSTTTTLQLPAGTYKLKFNNHFFENVVVTTTRSREILLGTISLPNLARTAEIYDQKSSAAGTYSVGYAGTLSPTTKTLQVPIGTYKLKFDNHFFENVAVTPARSPEILLGTINLPNLARTAEIYDQKSNASGTYSVGYAGTVSPVSRMLQVPAGTYKIKFDNLFTQGIGVDPGKTVVAQ
ncbi:MAG: TIR domain-containing protein [Acidobacteriota bacterium]